MLQMVICSLKSVGQQGLSIHSESERERKRESEHISLCWHISSRIYRLRLGSTNLLTVSVVACLSVYLSIHPSPHLYIYLSFICLSAFDRSIMCDKLSVCLRLLISSGNKGNKHKQREREREGDNRTSEVSRLFLFPFKIDFILSSLILTLCTYVVQIELQT